MQQFTRRVVEEQAASIRSEFDLNLATELDTLYKAIDAALDAEIAEDASLSDWPANNLKQKAFVLAAFRKVINDLLGCVETLRAGYFDLCQGVLRSALEGFATAILIDKDKEIFKAYRDGRFSVNKAVERFANQRDMVTNEAGKQFLGVYKRLHKMAHPTVVAMAVQSPPAGGNFPIGGVFYPLRLRVYRAVTNEMTSLAQNIEGYLKTQFPKGRPLP